MTRPTAISKNQAMSQSSKEVEKFLERAMPIINKNLRNFVDGTTKVIHASSLGMKDLDSDVREKVKIEIVQEYRAQGWNVRFVNGDQRDNDDWFNFS